MVEFNDGAHFAQLSYPDMKLAIGFALEYGEQCSMFNVQCKTHSVKKPIK
jgi:1-deoxy-D-xylulose 5-phosphate reductoisomerase